MIERISQTQGHCQREEGTRFCSPSKASLRHQTCQCYREAFEYLDLDIQPRPILGILSMLVFVTVFQGSWCVVRVDGDVVVFVKNGSLVCFDRGVKTRRKGTPPRHVILDNFFTLYQTEGASRRLYNSFVSLFPSSPLQISHDRLYICSRCGCFPVPSHLANSFQINTTKRKFLLTYFMSRTLGMDNIGTV
jgi:hypothetical protein